MNTTRLNLRSMWAIASLVCVALGRCGGVPQNASCVPITYPEASKSVPVSYRVERYQVADPFAEVTGFYDEHLNPISRFRDATPGEWQVERIDASQTLYSCRSALNWQEVEQGCMYVRQEAEYTLIETVWYFSASAAPWCEPNLSVIR